MNRTQGRNCSVLPCSVIEISSGLPLLIVGGRFVFLLYFILSLISRKVQIIVSKMYKNKGVKGMRDQNLIAEWEGIGTTSFFWLWVESSPRELQDTDLVLARECISWDIPTSLISYVCYNYPSWRLGVLWHDEYRCYLLHDGKTSTLKTKQTCWLQ